MTAPANAPKAPGGAATLAGRRVARIGFGAMQLAGGHGLPAPDRTIAVRILRTAVDEGVNHLDTAQFYAGGGGNELIREALHPFPGNLVLATKVGAESAIGAGGLGLVPAQRPEQLRAQVEANLATLGVDTIDVVNLRRLDAPPGIIAEGDQRVDLDSQLAELIALRDEGKIGGIGLSNVNAEQLSHALPAGIACVQNSYSLIDRASEPVLDICREHDIPWVPFCPLGSAFPGTSKPAEHVVVGAIASSIGASPAQVALAWLLTTYAHTLLIPGTRNPVHLKDNIAAGDVELSPGIVDTLNRLAASSE